MEKVTDSEKYKDLVLGTTNPKHISTEKQEQRLVINYLKTKYPEIPFNADMSGIYIPNKDHAKSASLDSNFCVPDIGIYAKGWLEYQGEFPMLFIELKKTSVNVFKKKSGECATPRIKDQMESLVKLQKNGFCAYMCIGFESAIQLIDKYLKS